MFRESTAWLEKLVYQEIQGKAGMAKKLGLVYHNLSVMLEAGVPVVRSLNTVTAGLEGKLQKAFRAVAKDVSSGKQIAEAMSKHPKVFEELDVLVIKAAEVSGSEGECFKLLSQWYDFVRRLKYIFISGMFLPVILIHLAAIIAPLPNLILSRITIFEYILQVLRILSLLYVPVVVIFGILHLTPKAGTFRRLLDNVTLRIPLLGQAIRKLGISRYCRTFHMLCKAAVPVDQCAQTASLMTGNTVITDLFKGGAWSVKKGEAVSAGFSGKLPLDLLDLWHVGEETGKLDDATKRIADMYADSAEQMLTEFYKWLPRIIYFLIGILIAILILRNFAMIMSTRVS